MDRITLQTNVLQANQERAAENRKLFEREGALVINLMSAPGSGKTSLLECTIRGLRDRCRIGVIEGDLQTEIDSERIRALGAPSYQITTGTVCHLDARMIARALEEFPIRGLDLLFIENVGNLICPASYFLGEHRRVVICGATEGAEKPRKYPVMFHKADAVVLNKVDLAGACGVDLELLRANVRDVNPRVPIFALSCRTGQGLAAWLAWLAAEVAAHGVLATERASI
jgi:hydrogenase nickel incorporation protein HypB